MTDDEPNSGKPWEDWEITDSMLEDATDWLVRYIDEGPEGPGSGTGIAPRDVELEADDLVVSVWLGGEELAERSFEPEPWEEYGPDEPGPDAEHIAYTLLGELFAEYDLEERLVEDERERLADLVVEEAETAILARLQEADPDRDWDLSLEVVERSHDYHHGDPEWVYEQGYPPFGLEVRSWDPDAETVVEIEYEPPDVDRLVDDAVDELLETVGDPAERERLADRLLDEAEARVHDALTERFPDHDWHLSVEIVERPRLVDVAAEDANRRNPPYGLVISTRDRVWSRSAVGFDAESDPEAVLAQAVRAFPRAVAVDLELARLRELASEEIIPAVEKALDSANPAVEWELRFDAFKDIDRTTSRSDDAPPLELTVQNEGPPWIVTGVEIDGEPNVGQVVEAVVDDLLEKATTARLRTSVLGEAERKLRSTLGERAPEFTWRLSLDIVLLEDLDGSVSDGDVSQPSYALKVRSLEAHEPAWSTRSSVRASTVVPIEHDPPDVDRLVDAAVDGLLEAVDDE